MYYYSLLLLLLLVSFTTSQQLTEADYKRIMLAGNILFTGSKGLAIPATINCYNTSSNLEDAFNCAAKYSGSTAMYDSSQAEKDQVAINSYGLPMWARFYEKHMKTYNPKAPAYIDSPSYDGKSYLTAADRIPDSSGDSFKPPTFLLLMGTLIFICVQILDICAQHHHEHPKT